MRSVVVARSVPVPIIYGGSTHKAMLSGLVGRRGDTSKKNANEARLEAEIKYLKNTVVEITHENINFKKNISDRNQKPF